MPRTLDAPPEGPIAEPRPGDPRLDPVERATSRRRRSNLRVLAALLAGTVVVAATAFWAGAHVRGHVSALPRHVAEPAPTALVRRGRLVDELQAPGTVVRGPELPVRPLASGAAGGAPIVTRLPLRTGASLVEGSVAGEVSGVPVIVLRGPIPMYRSLTNGDAGADVAQLQAALGRLGYAIWDPLGHFGPSTAAAVTAMFAARGYGPELLHPAGTPHPRHKPAPVVLPAGAVVYLPRFPLRIARVTASVGSAPSGALLQVAAAPPRVRAAIDVSQLDAVRRGMRATIVAAGRRISGRVQALPSAGGTDTHVTIAPGAGWRVLRVGREVQVRVRLGRSRPGVLSVPYSAVITAADGSTELRVQAAGGRWRTVPVALGFSAGGYVVVRPLQAGALAAGQAVAVGG
jgi:peptidoglycan hydrolase-like protein with peptidoglycan-binding domain